MFYYNSLSSLFTLILAIQFCLISCSSEQVQNSNSNLEKKNSAITEKVKETRQEDTTSIHYYLNLVKHAQPAEAIAPHLCSKYIEPALKNKPLHPYLAQAIYSYGDIAYQDSSIVAISFYYKAVHDKNLLAASFLATYSLTDGRYLDCKMVFGSSTFNFQESKGYNLGLSCKSELEFIDQDGYILQLNSVYKELYSHFKAGIAKKKNSQYNRLYFLNKEGKFEDKSVPALGT